MMNELDQLLAELREWATNAKHGDQKALAQELEVPQQRLNHWITGRRLPNIRDGLKLQTWLKKHHRKP